MSYETALLLAYILIFSLLNLFVFALYYLFGFVVDRSMRGFTKILPVAPQVRFLFHFKGIRGDLKSVPSAVSAGCEIFALIYLTVSEAAFLAATVAFNNAVNVCRAAFLITAVLIAAWIFLIFWVKGLKCRRMAELETAACEPSPLQNDEKIISIILNDEDDAERYGDAPGISEGKKFLNEISQKLLDE